MQKNSKIGDSVAAEMDKILNDPAFKSVFEPTPEDFSQVVNADPTYSAFIRVAKKKDEDEEEDEKEEKKGKKAPPFGKKDKKEEKEDKKDKKDKDKKEDKKDKKKDKKEDKKVKAQAIEYIINSLITTSEALDNLGLDKSATVALGLLNGIIKEAQFGDFGGDFEDTEEPSHLMGLEGDLDIDLEDEEEEDPELLRELNERVPGFSREEGESSEGMEDGIDPELFLADDKEDKKEKKDKEEDKEEEDDKKEKEEDEDEEEDEEEEDEDENDLNIFANRKITNKRAIALMNEINEWIKK